MPKYRVIEAQQVTQIEVWSYEIEADSEATAIERVRTGKHRTDDGPALVHERYGDIDHTDLRGFAIDRGNETKAIDLAVASLEEECE